MGRVTGRHLKEKSDVMLHDIQGPAGDDEQGTQLLRNQANGCERQTSAVTYTAGQGSQTGEREVPSHTLVPFQQQCIILDGKKQN